MDVASLIRFPVTPASVFRYSVIAFIAGIFAGSSFPEATPIFSLALISFAVAVIGIWQERRTVFISCILIACAAGCFLAAHSVSYWLIDRPPETVSGIAEIIRKPAVSETYREAVVTLSSCETGPCPADFVLVRFPLLTDISYGDKGTFSCALELPDATWKTYYAKDGIAYRCREPVWRKTGETQPIRRALLGISSGFESAIAHALPEPESSFAIGLLIGGSGQLPASVRDDFRAAGLTHIVAVSGYNISIIAEYFLLLGIVLFLPRRKAVPFSLLGTAAFVFVAGAPASAVRALGMASTMLLAQWIGRRYANLWALCFAAAVMLALNPMLLLYDVGFQLSFLATAGIIVSSPIVRTVLRKAPHAIESFFEALLLTVSANAFLMPVIFANFGKFAPIAIVANAVLLPAIPLAMLFSFVAGVAGAVSAPLGAVFAFPAYATLAPIIAGAHFAASFRDSAIVWDHFGWAETIVWYAVVFPIFFLLRHKFGNEKNKIRKNQAEALPE